MKIASFNYRGIFSYPLKIVSFQLVNHTETGHNSTRVCSHACRDKKRRIGA